MLINSLISSAHSTPKAHEVPSDSIAHANKIPEFVKISSPCSSNRCTDEQTQICDPSRQSRPSLQRKSPAFIQYKRGNVSKNISKNDSNNISNNESIISPTNNSSVIIQKNKGHSYVNSPDSNKKAVHSIMKDVVINQLNLLQKNLSPKDSYSVFKFRQKSNKYKLNKSRKNSRENSKDSKDNSNQNVDMSTDQ